MKVTVHKNAADDFLGSDFDSKDPKYIPVTITTLSSLHNSSAMLTKKRKINLENREIAKRRRNQDLEYTSSTTKKIVKEKTRITMR